MEESPPHLLVLEGDPAYVLESDEGLNAINDGYIKL